MNKSNIAVTNALFAVVRRSRRQTAGIARTNPMYVSFPLHKRKHTVPLLSEPTEVAVDEADPQLVAPSQPVEDAVNQDDSLPSLPAVEVAVDEADPQSVAPSQPVEDAVNQDDSLPSLPAVEVAVDEADPQSVAPSQPVADAVNQDDSLPSLPAVEVAVDEADPQSQCINLNIQQQPDGTCIFSLPDNFTGEAFINIHTASNEVVSNTGMLSVDASGWADGDGCAPMDVMVEEETSDQNSDEMEENIDAMSLPSASRKRQRRKHTWQKNIRKMKRTKGEQYVSDTTHKVVKARSVKPVNCSKCRLKCNEKVSEEQRQALCTEFYALNSWEAQTAYLVQSIMQFEPARRATKNMQSDNGPRKTQSRAYYMTISDGSSSNSVRVCKEMFLKTFDVNTARVHYALMKQKASQGLCDERGSKVNASKTPSALTDAVKEHIAKFPRYVSHYTRSKNSREFLTGVSSISEMYRLYVDDCKANSMMAVSEWVYRRIFNSDFNLAFRVPKTDTCKKCDMFAVEQKLDDADHLAVRQEWDSHLLLAENTRAKLNEDKQHAKDGQKLVFAFDLQKTKPLPYLNTNEAYYKRQLAVYNCGIHDCGSNQGYFHIWHEAMASRGPAEIASCLWHWLGRLYAGKNIPSEWVAYSDSCGGQNRNAVIAAFWSHAVQEMQVDCIDHIFMVSGHSFMPCDEDFGIDEKEKRKNETVFTLGEWIDIAKRARKKGEKFDVAEMPKNAFLDFKVLLKQIVNRKVNMQGEKVEWMKIRWMRFRKDNPYKMMYKYTVGDDEFKEVNFQKQRKGRQQQKPIQNLPMLYPSGRRISQAKFKDIQDLMKYVPPVHHEFYKSIPHEQHKSSESEVAEDVNDHESDAMSDVNA